MAGQDLFRHGLIVGCHTGPQSDCCWSTARGAVQSPREGARFSKCGFAGDEFDLLEKVSGVRLRLSSGCEVWVVVVSRVQPRRTGLVPVLKVDLLTTRFMSRRSHPPDMAVPLGLQSRESGWSREEDDVGAVLDGGNST